MSYSGLAMAEYDDDDVVGQIVKQVRSFRYLGSSVDEDGRCDA